MFEYDLDDGLNLIAESFLFQYKMLFGEFGDAKLRRSYFGLEGRMRTEVTIENIIVTIYFVGTTFFA